MPIYEYKCSKGHLTVKIHGIKESLADSIICPDCKETQTRPGPGIRAALVPSLTGPPILKAGKGGFYKPNRP